MPSIKDIIAGQSVGVGKRVIKAGADKLRGIINDRGLGNLPSFGPFSTVNLTYPLDVAEDPRQGHYVIFTVREISKPAKLEVDSDGKVKLENGKDISEDNLITVEDPGNGKTYGRQTTKNKDGKIIKTENVRVKDVNLDEISRDGKNRYAIRPPTKRTSTLITLYMPPQVKNITGAEYESIEMSPLTTIGTAFGTSLFREVNMESMSSSALKQLGKAAASFFENVGFGGASDSLQLAKGVMVADRMEFVFRNPKKRAFPYQFDFYPKSEREAQEVHEIIKTFRKHMLPSMFVKGSQGANPIFNVPHEFNIEYYYKGNENSFLNKIGNCYLTDCDVTYGGDKYTSFPTSQTKKGESGASPTEIHLNLNFQEMDVITHEDVEDGF